VHRCRREYRIRNDQKQNQLMTQMMTQKRETEKEQNDEKWNDGPQANENK